MSYTIIFYVKKNPSLSYAEFKQHYENIHMPLVKSATGSTFPNRHTRYYVQHSSSSTSQSATHNTLPPAMIYGTPKDVTYDAVVMLEFDDEQAWKNYENELATCEKSKDIWEDAPLFMEVGSAVAVVVEEGRVTERDYI